MSLKKKMVMSRLVYSGVLLGVSRIIGAYMQLTTQLLQQDDSFQIDMR